MLDQIEIKGYFWTPQYPDDQLPGLLKFDPQNGIELELWGRFDKYKDPSSLDDNILLGFSSDGKKITLLNCFENSRGMSLPGFALSAFSAIYMFIGEHFPHSSAIQFEKVILEYEDLNFWLDTSGFSKPKYDEEEKKIQLSYKQPEAIRIPINTLWNAEIIFDFYRPAEYSIPINSATIEQRPMISFTATTPQVFKKFHETYSAFSSLLAVCYFVFPVIKSLQFHTPNLIKGKHEPEFKVIQLYYSTGNRINIYKPHHNRHNFLIQYKDVLFTQLVEKWFILNEKIAATIDILTENLMKRGMSPTEFIFLGYVQALENMHRQITGKKTILKDRLDAIVQDLPAQIKDALLKNEIDFTIRIKNHRNYFTHYNPPQNNYVKASINELFVLSEKMKVILITYLLKELSLDNAAIEKIIIGKGIYLFNHIIEVNDVKKWGA